MCYGNPALHSTLDQVQFLARGHAMYLLSVCQDLSKTRNVSLASSDPHKLDLMAENSSLKVKLAKAEKSLRDSEERFGIAQVCWKLVIFFHFQHKYVYTYTWSSL